MVIRNNVISKTKIEQFGFVEDFIKVSRDLSKEISSIDFSSFDFTVYNPLDYAQTQNENYIRSFLLPSVKSIFLGMNPGPFGMAQTGVPFGDIEMVRDWLGISGIVDGPPNQHPKRPIQGFACQKREVSGSRLWGWARNRFNSPDKFFKDFFVWNYCPLVFMEPSGANKTPDKLPPELKAEVFSHCDLALRRLVEISGASQVIGVGKFARKRAEVSVGDIVDVGDILHPSPASPKANKNWAGEIELQLTQLGCL